MSSSSAAADAKRLVLGCAGIGMAYGRPSAAGEAPQAPASDDIAALLLRATELGLSIADTAPAYGASEALLGSFWDGSLWSKIGFEDTLEESFQKLQRPYVDALQWHNWHKDLLDNKAFVTKWESLVADDRCRRLGVTVYGAEDALAASQLPGFGLIQMPWNIFDQQSIAEISQTLRQRGVELAARSVYLQGLLAGRQPPTEAQALADPLREVTIAANKRGLSRPAYALRAALDCPDLDWVLVGCDHASQLDVVAEALHAEAIPSDEIRRWCQRCRVSSQALDPRTWH